MPVVRTVLLAMIFRVSRKLGDQTPSVSTTKEQKSHPADSASFSCRAIFSESPPAAADPADSRIYIYYIYTGWLDPSVVRSIYHNS